MESCVSINSISLEEVASNIDLLTLILVRVPAKSLVRFKCVSNHWLSLISDSKFSNNHSRKSLKHSVSGLYIDSYPLINFNTKSIYPRSNLPKLDFLTTSSGVKPTILHSCNGLMLCSRGRDIIVCNLTTQKFKVIPSISCQSGLRFKFLSCNPISSPHYKVISIGIKVVDLLECSGYSYYIIIYSSKTGMCKELINYNGPKFELFSSMVLCDRAIYWMNDTKNLSWFDIDEENFETIPISAEPVLFLENYTFSYFGESDGRLFLVQTRMQAEYQIFEMDKNSFRWTLKYDLNVSGMEWYHKLCDIWGAYVLHFKEGDEEEAHAPLLAYRKKIISYNPSNNCWVILQDLPDYDHEPFGNIRRRAHKFIESMASV